ncbi:MAG TPA: hypothetical protein VFQ67_06585 [Allosphingosinicella sp.]|jgi:flagellar basal body-associated protein FliL|nr:hypothetical protein [Allosphingosinicella sp.]
MNDLPLTLQIILAIPILVGATLFLCAPEILANWIVSKRDDSRRERAQLAELDRKIAIAEAAAAARARGEPFLPPADYDR